MSPILDDDKVYVQYDNLIQNTFLQVTVNGIKQLISKVLYFKANMRGSLPNAEEIKSGCGRIFFLHSIRVVASSTKTVTTKQTNVYDSSDLELGQHECISNLL